MLLCKQHVCKFMVMNALRTITQVKQASRVAGLALNSIHKGLHIADDIRNLGAVGNTNAGESNHKDLKKSRRDACLRAGNNEVHIIKNWNDNQALKSLSDSVTWDACGFENGKEMRKEVTAGPLCREVLQDVFAFLPAMQLSPASVEDGTTTGRQGGRPHGYQQWTADLKGVDAGIELQTWQEEVFKMLPSPQELDQHYADYFGCGRIDGEAPCNTRTCSYCWRNRTYKDGLVHDSVEVFNHWGGAPGEANAGTGTVRGCPVKDAGRHSGWTRSTASRGSDVEIYLTANDQREGRYGLEQTTLGKVAFFFEHQGNPWRRDDESNVLPEGEYTIWMAVSEYVTAGVGNNLQLHHTTGLAEFKMRHTLTFYPTPAIRRVVHMMHACPTSGESACGLVRESKRQWRCNLLGTSTYLLNKYFHSPGRDSID
ncbi:unnamed protein product [Ectocarpus sp. CCAP 1310/34]|nr:unnamed protein product [Ectocarpus sp. CCAP 1310/34]